MLCDRSKFDLILADILEGFPPPNVSSPLERFSDWKKHDTNHIEALFEFEHSYLNDNACMLLMIPKIKGVSEDVMTYA